MQSKQEQEMLEMLKELKFLEEIMRTTTSQGVFPNHPGGQVPSPDCPFPGVGLGIKAMPFPPHHSAS